MKTLVAKTAILATLLVASNLASASTYNFYDTDLGSGTTFSQPGFTMVASTSNGGELGNIEFGEYAGLWVGKTTSSSGLYKLSFSQNISWISIQFDALSATGQLPVETISNFATSNGAVAINYSDLFGTSFDGSSIYSSTNNGRGLITFSGAAFSDFSFRHTQNPSQNGFVIENIMVSTSPVPEPET